MPWFKLPTNKEKESWYYQDIKDIIYDIGILQLIRNIMKVIIKERGRIKW